MRGFCLRMHVSCDVEKRFPDHGQEHRGARGTRPSVKTSSLDHQIVVETQIGQNCGWVIRIFSRCPRIRVPVLPPGSGQPDSDAVSRVWILSVWPGQPGCGWSQGDHSFVGHPPQDSCGSLRAHRRGIPPPFFTPATSICLRVSPTSVAFSINAFIQFPSFRNSHFHHLRTFKINTLINIY